jgi:hypothetical protein
VNMLYFGQFNPLLFSLSRSLLSHVYYLAAFSTYEVF